jgi:hypothetical protein
MNRSEDLKLADNLQRSIDDYGQPGANTASVAEEQDWINTARLAVGPLRSGAATDEQRDAARAALKHTPPPRS